MVYGASPAHLLVLLASFAVCGYAAARLLQRDWFDVAKWVVGAALLHDLVLVPLYAVADWVLHRALRTPGPGPSAPPAPHKPSGATEDPPARDRTALRIAAVHHIRVPVFLSLLLLLVYWPLISRVRTHYAQATGLDPGVFLGRWVLITAGLLGASALLFAVRWWRMTRRPGRKGLTDR
nr:hypothetical protein [Actinacidiphila yanglinensis]